eukprot:CAMPEP_0119310812 /NCGR_PEP_ID=MMETSP1333-20130426/20323_1 /TAXON_ID=418940 /ORGANISM="Scyphosphaera apsteinii, Strain RCC1455" /LENGTH=255 /DNA_ID=CAMNT_0007315063 /DNA_START=144 /DNA_END=911 /DNA_ORIENTATION=+
MVESTVPRAATSTPRSMRSDGLHAADRYVSTVRFLVPNNEQVAFEHTWTARADQLAESKGLRYFQMTKRAADFMGPPLPDDEFNYQSFCVWDSKAAFEACAVDFSEDVGRAANYDGLFALALPPAISNVPPGDRAIDMSVRLPREAFVASNRFGIKSGFERDFEDMWAARDSSLADLPGFVNFQLLRREDEVDDDNTYISYTTWKNVQAFNSWRNSENFKRSHSNSRGDKESPYAKMPKVVTFQTFLVVSADDGM